MTAERVEPLIGRTLGEFVLREPIGQGGFGAVYRAIQPALEREAVIKVMKSRLLTTEAGTQRFLREARLASRLDHPYAAHIYAFGAERDGTLWIAMELVRGTPLDELLRTQGPLPVDRFVPFFERMCEVIETAHEQGIVHRDIKPANVMVLARAGRLLPKLLDLGIAKGLGDPETDAPPVALEPARTDQDATGLATTRVEVTARASLPRDHGGELTQRGVVIGSPGYMAPEQWLDAAAADPRSDTYALGVLAFESLTGRLPFVGSLIDVAQGHAHEPVPPLGDRFPAGLDAVLSRAMAKRADDRYQSALDLAAAFRAASGVAADLAQLPRLAASLRAALLADAPTPLAQAVSALDSARNPHQQRDALWEIVRVVLRLVGAVAIAGHSQVGSGSTDPSIGEAIRRLLSSRLADLDWLEIARELCRPFAGLRDAHPVPEVVGLLLDEPYDVLAELVAERSGSRAGGGSEQAVRDWLEQLMPVVERALGLVSFFSEYRLVAATSDGAEVLMGAQGRRRPFALTSRDLVPGRLYLTSADGVPVVSLWPFVQLRSPAPGMAERVFFFDGRGSRGARLVAFPDPFEAEDDEMWPALGGLLGDPGVSQGEAADDDACPFPGLSAFTRDDAGHFFGRERETEAFLNRIRLEPLLAVVGPSGVGKSSFVQAGVIPGLPASWQAFTVRPGPAPLAALAARLRAAGIEPGELRGEPDRLGVLLRCEATARGATFVLVVDQLEELFTVCEDPAERALFADGLVRAAPSADDPVRVVLTLRDDFLLRAEALPAFSSRLGHALQLLTTPAERELRRILVEPVRRAGYEFDDADLPAEMVRDVASEPGALALLSFTASKLWELRDRGFRRLGRKAYVSLGGVGGALAQHAESVMRAMRAEEQLLVREVFRHAVTAAGTRAILSRTELDQVLGAGPHVETVIEKLVAARLLVTESESGGEQIEIAHEALLEAWPRLVTWRREDAEGARLRDQLRTAARQWEERKRASGLLWRGDALAELRLWRTRYPGALTASEEAFAAHSLSQAERERRIKRRLIAAGFALLLAVAVGLVILSLRVAGQRERAVASEARMAENLRRQYETQGRRLVLDEEPRQALAYLAKAASLGVRGAAHDFLVAQAVRATEGQVVEVEQSGSIFRARFSPDGRRLATAGSDYQATIWDAESGARPVALRHAGSVRRINFSPDGRRVLTASSDGAARLWDSATGRLLHTLVDRDRPPVQEALFSPHGDALLTVGADESVRLWDPDTGELAAVLRPPAGSVVVATGYLAAFSQNGELVAAAAHDGAVRVWRVAARAVVAELVGHRAAVNWVGFSPDGRTLATASSDATAGVWDLASGERLAVLAHRQAVNSAVFSADGERVLTAAEDGTAQVWDWRLARPLTSLNGHLSAVNLARFSPDGRQIATASTDSTVQLWDAHTGRRVARLLGHPASVLDLDFDAAGSRLVSGCAGGRGIVWTTEPQERITFLGAGGATWAEFSSDGNSAVTTAQDGTVRIFEAARGRELVSLRGHRGAVTMGRFSPDDRRIATSGEDATVRIWDPAAGRLLTTLEGHRRRVQWVAWHPDGSRVASASDDGTVRVWSIATGAAVVRFSPKGGYPFFSAEFTPSGAALVASADDGTTHVIDADTGRKLATYRDPDQRWRNAFDRSGRRVASATFTHVAKIWRLDTGATVTELVGHAGEVMTTRFAPADDLVVTGSADGTARVWDAERGDLLAVLGFLGSPVRSATFSPDGTRILLAGDGGAAVWELPRFDGSPEELARLLRCRVPYVVEGDKVVLRSRDPSECTGRPPIR